MGKTKKKKNRMFLIFGLTFIVAIISALFYGGSAGWFKGGTTMNSVVNNNYETTNSPASGSSATSTPVQNTPTENISVAPDVSLWSGIANVFGNKQEVPDSEDLIIPVLILPKTCDDSDGNTALNSAFVPGYVLADGTGTNDICISSSILVEYSCSDSNELDQSAIDCTSYGKVCGYDSGRAYCKNKVICSDSDEGIASMHQGTCVDEAGTHIDTCGRSTTGLTEYYCRNNMCVTTSITCGYCGGGACQEALY